MRECWAGGRGGGSSKDSYLRGGSKAAMAEKEEGVREGSEHGSLSTLILPGASHKTARYHGGRARLVKTSDMPVLWIFILLILQKNMVN